MISTDYLLGERNFTNLSNFITQSILVICQEPFKKDFDMDFLKKGNLNRPSIQRD